MSFYDHFARRQRIWAGVMLKEAQAKKIFALVGSGIGIESRVLEFGPGDGYIARLVRNVNADYEGIEGSTCIANMLSEKGFKIKRQIVPPVPDDIGQYDYCFMLHILEHMTDFQSAAALLEATRNHLKEHGKLVIATPDFVRWGVDFYDCDYSHSLPLTRRRLRQLLDNSGFEVFYENIYTGPIFGFAGLPLSWLARILYWRSLDNILAPLIKSDSWYRGYLSFLPCVVMVARLGNR